MASRLELHEKLCTVLGSRNVYFQPPESVKMKYPAIRYSLSNIRNTYANGGVYKQDNAYELTVIVSDPDSIIKDKVSKLPNCRFGRAYVTDNLYHYNFTIYY